MEKINNKVLSPKGWSLEKLRPDEKTLKTLFIAESVLYEGDEQYESEKDKDRFSFLKEDNDTIFTIRRLKVMQVVHKDSIKNILEGSHILLNLQFLEMEGNKIETIEPLNNISRNLKKLDISNNNISTCKNLRKLNTTYLEKLDISGNPICEIDFLSQMNLIRAKIISVPYMLREIFKNIGKKMNFDKRYANLFFQQR